MIFSWFPDTSYAVWTCKRTPETWSSFLSFRGKGLKSAKQCPIEPWCIQNTEDEASLSPRKNTPICVYFKEIHFWFPWFRFLRNLLVESLQSLSFVLSSFFLVFVYCYSPSSGSSIFSLGEFFLKITLLASSCCVYQNMVVPFHREKLCQEAVNLTSCHHISHGNPWCGEVFTICFHQESYLNV